MTIHDELGPLSALLARAAGALREAGFTSMARDLSKLPPLTDRGAPLTWDFALTKAARASSGSHEACAACLRVQGAMCQLLSELIQDRLVREGRAA